jgi:hypothetical protein
MKVLRSSNANMTACFIWEMCEFCSQETLCLVVDRNNDEYNMACICAECIENLARAHNNDRLT